MVLSSDNGGYTKSLGPCTDGSDPVRGITCMSGEVRGRRCRAVFSWKSLDRLPRQAQVKQQGSLKRRDDGGGVFGRLAPTITPYEGANTRCSRAGFVPTRSSAEASCHPLCAARYSTACSTSRTVRSVATRTRTPTAILSHLVMSLFQPFILKNDLFTKTGSGQT